jgi:hypothetical protein
MKCSQLPKPGVANATVWLHLLGLQLEDSFIIYLMHMSFKPASSPRTTLPEPVTFSTFNTFELVHPFGHVPECQ